MFQVASGSPGRGHVPEQPLEQPHRLLDNGVVGRRVPHGTEDAENRVSAVEQPVVCTADAGREVLRIGRRRKDSLDSSLERTHAQSRAGTRSSRGRLPYIAGCESSPATVPRAAALQTMSVRSLDAYGSVRSNRQRRSREHRHDEFGSGVHCNDQRPNLPYSKRNAILRIHFPLLPNKKEPSQ